MPRIPGQGPAKSQCGADCRVKCRDSTATAFVGRRTYFTHSSGEFVLFSLVANVFFLL